MVEPYFTMLWSHDTPTVVVASGDGDALVDITVIAGSLDNAEAPSPPPNSWASNAEPMWRSGTFASILVLDGRCRQPARSRTG